jgi:hypothetical protein
LLARRILIPAVVAIRNASVVIRPSSYRRLVCDAEIAVQNPPRALISCAAPSASRRNAKGIGYRIGERSQASSEEGPIGLAGKAWQSGGR